MKKFLVLMAILLAASSMKATHHMTYFVFVETNFAQGYWKDAELTYDHGGTFLYPYKYTDLFGTVKEDFYRKLLDRLEEHHEFYGQVKLGENELKTEGYREYYDTLNVALHGTLTPSQLRMLRNELTATILNAGECKAVRLIFHENGRHKKTEVLDYSSLDYPVFELVTMEAVSQPVERVVEQTVHDTIYQTRTDTVFKEPKKAEAKGDAARCWDRYLWLGIIVVLVIYLWKTRSK